MTGASLKIIGIILMETSDLLRHQLIKNLIAEQPTENVADATIHMWEQMATQIISIVGEDGFNSLYARSIFLSQSKFPWLAASQFPPKIDHRFAGLKTSLGEKVPTQAGEANALLMITFTDILASLIGEQLTMHILRLAWDTDIFE